MATVNSALRTLLAFVVVGMVGAAGWFGYSLYHAPQQALAEKQKELDGIRGELAEQSKLAQEKQVIIDGLELDIAAKEEEIARLDTAMRLLKVDHRLAELRVLRQEKNADTGRLASIVEFVEVNDDGAMIDKPRQFDIDGDLVYIECLVAKFEDRFVEASDLHRATSICFFQRIFSEFQEPSDGFELDRVGTRPTAYARGREMSDFERQIWNDFWSIANDRRQAEKLGIRAAHIEAPAIKVRPDKTYRLQLRASGGLTITPIDAPPDPGV
jgi:hypothetical protein